MQASAIETCYHVKHEAKLAWYPNAGPRNLHRLKSLPHTLGPRLSSR
jgi:hypothetical protein